MSKSKICVEPAMSAPMRPPRALTGVWNERQQLPRGVREEAVMRQLRRGRVHRRATLAIERKRVGAAGVEQAEGSAERQASLQ